jgi:hypothetical protein
MWPSLPYAFLVQSHVEHHSDSEFDLFKPTYDIKKLMGIGITLSAIEG